MAQAGFCLGEMYGAAVRFLGFIAPLKTHDFGGCPKKKIDTWHNSIPGREKVIGINFAGILASPSSNCIMSLLIGGYSGVFELSVVRIMQRSSRKLQSGNPNHRHACLFDQLPLDEPRFASAYFIFVM